MVLKACSQTGHYSPQPSTEWACVGECVCERIGRCAPLSWKCPKISQQQICHLHNGSFLFFRRSEIFLTSFHLKKGLRRTCLVQTVATGRASASYGSSRSGNSYSVVSISSQGAQRCPCQCTLLKSTTSSVNTANKGGIQSAGLPG